MVLRLTRSNLCVRYTLQAEGSGELHKNRMTFDFFLPENLPLKLCIKSVVVTSNYNLYRTNRMIFYFSGTGNSRWIAYRLAEELREELVFIPDALRLSGGSPEADPGMVEHSSGSMLPEFIPKPGEHIGFVFPVYSWGPPAIVLEFIRKLTLSSCTDRYTFFVCSCGDETGLTPDRMHQALNRKGWKCHAGFSVCMPNNYILFPVSM